MVFRSALLRDKSGRRRRAAEATTTQGTSFKAGQTSTKFSSKTTTVKTELVIHSDKVERESLVIGKLIGSGGCGLVFSVELRGRIEPQEDGSHGDSSRFVGTNEGSSKTKYAIKCLNDSNCPKKNERAASDLAFEAAILSRIQHENILGLRAVSHDFPSNKQGRFLILDYIEETLKDRLERWKEEQRPSLLPLVLAKRGRRDEVAREQRERVLSVGLPLAKALEYLHEQKIVHRDIKPNNIGFDAHGKLRLFDFGLARFAEEERFGCAGTLRYIAPEIHFGKDYSYPADVFSYSFVLWEVLCLEKLLPMIHSTWQMERIVYEGKVRPPLPLTMPRDLKKLLRQSWHWDASARPSSSEIVCSLQVFLHTTA